MKYLTMLVSSCVYKAMLSLSPSHILVSEKPSQIEQTLQNVLAQLQYSKFSVMTLVVRQLNKVVSIVIQKQKSLTLKHHLLTQKLLVLQILEFLHNLLLGILLLNSKPIRLVYLVVRMTTTDHVLG